MAFFPRNFYNSDASFTPLFRLLEDFDNYSRQGNGTPSSGARGTHRNHVPTFQPKFDVREVEDAYELHGELPGMSKDDVSIEFTDPHTLHIRGRVERSYTAGTPPAGLLQQSSGAEMSGAITDGSSNNDAASTTTATGTERPRSPHQATVEDEEDDETNSTAQPTPATTVAEVDKSASAVAHHHQHAAAKKEPVDNAKYWVSERSIGEFSRVFNFPGQIKQDAVSAGFRDGILSIRVPKAPKHETRRIFIN
ncbi:hsp20-like protein [Colletotrichum scovillei]|uniref:Hsp20-like protein n=1 Tax=Colletotrichum scovillei TaxID=1209932 RepID=A0A9P7RK63_9PEZI|nr:hsp20-like protein [Colletotrichum scovillei]KAF4778003.1 hsp20-like protein [Colletotrichum scovillei]KAG7058753.1 hsp20-like protein [Colletotrichum scovillei]KAG7077356.1 hsp20-like protein [Colletotrichum scovillei]KAG7084469.1 hsp20-like protein [Colletotrichum scovillei]